MIAASMRRLEVFRAVVELGGVSAAAAHFGIAQPSVTAHILALEKQAGAPLFLRQRGRRHLRPTDAGEALYRYACEAATKSRELNEALQRVRSQGEQRLAIAAQRVLANALLPGVLAEFLAQHSEARVSLHSETQEAVWQRVRSGAADLALLFARRPPDWPGARRIGALELGFVAAPAHPLARAHAIRPEQLAAHGFVGGLTDSEFFRLLVEEMKHIGLVGCRFILHLQDTSAVKQAVMRNVGLACTFALAVREEVARGDLVMLDVAGPMPRLPVYGIMREDGAESLAEPFLQQVTRHLGLLSAAADRPR